MLSFKTNPNLKDSILLVKHVIYALWIPVKRLNFIYVSLNNIAVILNWKKGLKEALKALKLCYKASWNYVVDLCKIHIQYKLSKELERMEYCCIHCFHLLQRYLKDTWGTTIKGSSPSITHSCCLCSVHHGI